MPHKTIQYPLTSIPSKKREESFKCENKKGVSNDKLTLITRRDRTRKMWSFKNVTFNEYMMVGVELMKLLIKNVVLKVR